MTLILQALGASVAVALISLIGVLFFGNSGRLEGWQKYIIPAAVGVFLSLVLNGLIPQTLDKAPELGGLVVALGFIAFYVLANILHKKFHDHEAEDCDRKGAAMLMLVGDSIHNVADGVILGGAFLIDPAVGVATAIGLMVHELPQEIVEFGILIRAGYSKTRAALYNLYSASSIILGTVLIMVVSAHASDYIWVFTGVAAGNLLFLAASDLLPRIHGNLKNYGSVWHSATSILIGFVVMSMVLSWVHGHYGHGHTADEHDGHDEHMEEVIE